MRLPQTQSPPAPAAETIRRSFQSHFKTLLFAAILGLGALVLYWPVTHNAFVNFDDDLYVTANVHVQNGLTWESIKWAFSNPVSANWHPLTILSHMLDCQLYGLQPWGHHLTSVLLNALNIVLLFLLLHRLTGTTWRSASVAALFACHPLHVESVAWVAERKDVLSGCFGLLTLLFYVCYAQSRGDGNLEPNGGAPVFVSSRSYWLACFSFVLGLMSKPMLVTWPFVLLLLDYWPLERFKPGRSWPLVWEKIPFIALAAVTSVVTFLVQKQSGAVNSLQTIPLGMRCENALISYCRYLGKLFWPADLAVFYPLPGYWPLGWVVLAGALLTGLTVLAWFERRRYPFLLMGWLWFVGMLVPVIGLVQVGIQSMADRYTYLPSVGLLLLIVWGAYELSRHRRQLLIALTMLGSAAIVLCCAVTRQQIGYWKDSETLFRHALNVTPDNAIARNNLGATLLDQSQTNAAISQFQDALRLNPGLIMAHENLGKALTRQGKTEAAIAQFQAAIGINPNYAEAHNNLGNLFALNGQTNEAVSQFREAIRLEPDFADAHFNFGNFLALKGQTDEAIRQFEEALRDNPNDAETHNNLGNVLALKGRTDEAINQFQAALRLKPDNADAHYNYGNALTKLGDLDGAISQFQEALRLKPDDAEIHYKLGNLLARKGQIDDAIRQFQEAARLKPDFAEAHANLGSLLFRQGQTDEAISQFQTALRLKPDYAEASYDLGNAFLKAGRPDAAVTQFQNALPGLSNFAPAHFHLGVALAQQGQTDAAISQFREALRLNPNDAEARSNLERALESKNPSTGH